MNKQDKKIYSSLITRIAIALIANQVILGALASFVSEAEEVAGELFGGSEALDIVMRLGDCAVYMIGFCVPVVLFNIMSKSASREIYEPYECERLPKYMIPFAIGVGLGVTTLSANLSYAIINSFSDYSDFTQQYFWDVDLSTPTKAVIYFVYIAVIPAVVEELLFRRTVCRSLGVYGKGTAIVVSALLFALMHTNIEQLLYTFVAGMMLAWIYIETENIIYPMLLHFINNGISATGEILSERASTSAYNAFSGNADLFIWIFAAVSLLAFLAYIAKRGRIFEQTKMKPDENGEPVARLTRGERVRGFFSPMMILFVVYCIGVMMMYFLLSFILVE